MNITAEQLKKIMPLSGKRAETFLPFIVKAMERFEINTPLRASAFLGQVAHESGQLVYSKEIASGKAYEGRKDLGNTSPGDGVKYKGRGLIQLTGKTNYEAMARVFGIDCVQKPELIEGPEYSCLAAAWFWKEHGLNELADKQDYRTITKRINGGYNGYEDRLKFYEAAKQCIR
jgi:putative chitinase